ncbi:hypothetical protein V6N13_093734 [Hibiscus sabdariffa]|uniref:Uncharacterized protein n=1 Tax=Hibiscus sabdariffa TaxID=183260 RepID=A0ABR2BRW6_9ROSI
MGMAKEKVLAQAASTRKKRERLEAAAKVEKDKIKLKAEKDMHKHGEETKKLESKLSELKMKLDSSKIAALRRGIDGGSGQCSSLVLCSITSTPKLKLGFAEESWLALLPVSAEVLHFRTVPVMKATEILRCRS